MFMNLFLRWLLIALPFAALSACGDRKTEDAGTVRVVAITVPGTPWHDSWLHFRRELRARSDGELTPVFYIGGQLGSEETTLSQLRRGRVQLGGFSLQGASSVVPELGVLLAPYLFDSFEEVDDVMDRELWPLFEQLFAQKGLVLLSWAEVGWTNIYGKRPINTPRDALGTKLRSSNALASQLLVRSLGADMVPLPYPDILPSLQTGLIDGGESGTILYALAGVAEEAPYLNLTRHAFDTGVVLANRNWFDALSAAQRRQIRDSVLPAARARAAVRASERRILESAADRGIRVHQPDEAELAAWRRATAANTQRIIDAAGGRAERVYHRILEGKSRHGRRAVEPLNGPGTATVPASQPSAPAPAASAR